VKFQAVSAWAKFSVVTGMVTTALAEDASRMTAVKSHFGFAKAVFILAP